MLIAPILGARAGMSSVPALLFVQLFVVLFVALFLRVHDLLTRLAEGVEPLRDLPEMMPAALAHPPIPSALSSA